MTLKRDIVNLATQLALQETKSTGEDYTTAMSKAIEEACLRLGIKKEEYIKMFI